MKNSIFYWSIRAIFVIVLIFSITIFYKYWKLTKQKSVTDGNQTQTTTNNPDARVSPETTKILEGGEFPTVYASGELIDYKLLKNPETGEYELYVKLSTGDGVFPVHVSYFSTTGKEPKNDLIVKDINQEQKDQMISILEESKSKAKSILNNYIIISSIQNMEQMKSCASLYEQTLGQKWCSFDTNQKSYSATELLTLVKKYLEELGQNTDNLELSKYFSVQGNVFAYLQVNYLFLPESKN